MFSPWIRKIPRGGNGNPLQYSCLGNPMDRGAWQATVIESQSQTRLRYGVHSPGKMQTVLRKPVIIHREWG